MTSNNDTINVGRSRIRSRTSHSSIGSLESNNVLRCTICYENIINISNSRLSKICECRDSLICSDCMKELENNLVKKCPICRRNLNVKITYNTCKNFFVLANNFKVLISYFLINILFTNMVLYYRYYSTNKYIPDVLYSNLKDDNDLTNLVDFNYHQRIKMRHVLFLNKTFVFSVINFIYIFYYPIVTQIANYLIYDRHGPNARYFLNIINLIIITFMLLNFILLLIIVFDKKLNSIKLYVNYSIIIYTFYGFCIGSIYLFLYIRKKFNYIKVNYMKPIVNYNILDTIKHNIEFKSVRRNQISPVPSPRNNSSPQLVYSSNIEPMIPVIDELPPLREIRQFRQLVLEENINNNRELINDTAV